METDLNVLARQAQCHVARQPWSRHGEKPVPLEITFDAAGGGPVWRVRFVKGLNPGGKRQWGHAAAGNLPGALEAALLIQAAHGPRGTLMHTPGGSDD